MDKVKIGDIVRTHDDDYGEIVQETACFSVNGHNGKMYEVRPLLGEEETEWLYDDEIAKCGHIESIWQRVRASIFSQLKKMSKGGKLEDEEQRILQEQNL